MLYLPHFADGKLRLISATWIMEGLKMSGFSILRDGEREFTLRHQHEWRPIVMKTLGIFEQK